MIRSRLGLVTIGAGGSAADYTFDGDGLSNDPRLAYYLQSLTPAQLQTALDGRDESPDLIDLFREAETGTGRGSLPCGTPENPTCGPPAGAGLFGMLSGIPTWGWVAGGSVLALAFLGGRD